MDRYSYFFLNDLKFSSWRFYLLLLFDEDWVLPFPTFLQVLWVLPLWRWIKILGHNLHLLIFYLLSFVGNLIVVDWVWELLGGVWIASLFVFFVIWSFIVLLFRYCSYFLFALFASLDCPQFFARSWITLIVLFFPILKQLITLSNLRFLELLSGFPHLFSSRLHLSFYWPIQSIDRYVIYAFRFIKHLSCCNCFVLFRT